MVMGSLPVIGIPFKDRDPFMKHLVVDSCRTSESLAGMFYPFACWAY